MKPTAASILTINGGSSSIKFALFETGATRRRLAKGEISRIGLLAGRARGEGRKPARQRVAVGGGDEYTQPRSMS